MQANQPSLTAQRVALRRAAHQLLDHPVVFADPLALAILGPEAEAALRADPKSAGTSRIAPYLRAFLAARGSFAEEELARAVERGVGQYVVLGAGLDTFAFRNPYPPGALQVYEVDHPATQAWKRQRLAEAGIAVPPDLMFAPLDFQDCNPGRWLGRGRLRPGPIRLLLLAGGEHVPHPPRRSWPPWASSPRARPAAGWPSITA